MKCECGQECVWYYEIEGWLCLKCDGEHIMQMVKTLYKNKIEKTNQKEKLQCQD